MFFIVLTILLCICYCCFVMFLHRGWSLLLRQKPCQKTDVSVSVVMCHRDEPPSVLKSWYSVIDSQTRQVPRFVGDDDAWRVGKKEALRRLVSQATTDYCLFTDADVQVCRHWVEAVSEEISEADLLLLPVSIDVSDSTGLWQSLWQRIQALEFASLVGSGMAMCGNGHSIMCNGAGMAVKRTEWLQSWRDMHPEIPSGDDIFLLHSFKRRGLKIRYTTNSQTVVRTKPKQTLSDFWRQRTRWTSKASAYTDFDTLTVAAFVAATNLLALLLLAKPIFFVVFWIFKSLADYSFLKKLHILYNYGYTLPLTMLINIFYPFYVVATAVAGMFRGKQW